MRLLALLGTSALLFSCDTEEKPSDTNNIDTILPDTYEPPTDADGDGYCGDEDNCPNDPNPLQDDFDGDDIGDLWKAMWLEEFDTFDLEAEELEDAKKRYARKMKQKEAASSKTTTGRTPRKIPQTRGQLEGLY